MTTTKQSQMKEKKIKTYNLVTIQDMVACVTEENCEELIGDVSNMLRDVVKIKKENKGAYPLLCRLLFKNDGKGNYKREIQL